MAAAGHELKTPVAALHGYLQLVERNLPADSSDQARVYAARALVQTRQIGELLERLFDVNRIQAGRLALVAAPVDLVAVVRSAVDVAGTLPNAPTIRFLPTRGPILLQGDAVRLEASLREPALERHPARPGISDHRCQREQVRRARDRRSLRPGPRHPADVLPLLFKPYARLGQRASSGLGLGLGLYLAREIVTAHGGRSRRSRTSAKAP